ncbi:hypothetical protein K456DRAFT_58235 [Colletotrichum gloeosporioides 23]|nr:hypothetical protein K456DRAFT_58235 [Colletotrichum gloeosporioides 23]
MAAVQSNMITQLTSNHSPGPLQHIGEDACGSVWCASSKSSPYSANMPLVIKREDMSDVRSITHEAEMHHHILQALANPRVATTPTTFRVNIPLFQGLLHHTNSAAWSQILPRLLAGYAASNARHRHHPQIRDTQNPSRLSFYTRRSPMPTRLLLPNIHPTP